MENHKLQKKATEATAVAAVELSHLVVAKEFIESTKSQVSSFCILLSLLQWLNYCIINK